MQIPGVVTLQGVTVRSSHVDSQALHLGDSAAGTCWPQAPPRTPMP